MRPRWGLDDTELASYSTVYRSDLLAGQVALISGGGTGLGRAMAYLFARLGAQVMICGRRQEKLDETVAGIRTHLGREIASHAMTIRDPEAVAELLDETWNHFGSLDILVNNGGGQFPQAAIDFSVKGWNAVIDTNLNGTWYMMQQAAKRWRDAGRGGSIINIVADIWRGMPGIAHTCAARAGVVFATRSLAVEWAPLQIRVNCIAPGTIATPGLEVYPEEASRDFHRANPMLRCGDAMDIAEAAVYLATSSGKFITGECLTVDGGQQLWGEVWPHGRPAWFEAP
ncbi:MAG: short-chain dehydrogenase [Porticoccaceae bacterium]|nr:short-chain dehydrogenase [Porticoccaceae bacterium]